VVAATVATRQSLCTITHHAPAGPSSPRIHHHSEARSGKQESPGVDVRTAKKVVSRPEHILFIIRCPLPPELISRVAEYYGDGAPPVTRDATTVQPRRPPRLFRRYWSCSGEAVTAAAESFNNAD